MSSTPELIEKAKERLSEIEAEADRLRTFLAVYADLSGVNVGDNSAHPDGDEGTASPTQIVESAREVMRAKQRPLSRSRLVKALEAQGLKLPGKDKAKNIGTVIWRSKQFDNIAGYGYWPKDFDRWMGQRPRSANPTLETLMG